MPRQTASDVPLPTDSIQMTGDAVVIMMADESDDCRDVVRYWKKLNEGYDCVFGSRFLKGGGVIDYPWLKLRLNRLANLFIRILFSVALNDTTNAFKAYRKTVIDGCRPLISPHFNLTVEMPLKAIVRGYSWTVIPITWRNRRTGETKAQDQGDGQPLSLHRGFTSGWRNSSVEEITLSRKPLRRNLGNARDA